MKYHHHRRAARNAGFSLAELMVVIVIIGLLATQVVPRLFDSFGDAQLTKAKADINALHNAAESFAINNKSRWPDTLEQLVQKDENGRSYLRQESVPKDPWGNEYVYYPPQPGESQPVIMSLGKDGTEGGEDDITLRAIQNQEI